MSISNIIPRRDRGVKRNVVEGIILGIILTALSIFVGLSAGWIDTVNYLEVFAVFTSYTCTYLCVMERRINYVWGAVSTAAYCVLFFQWGLFASMGVNAYLALALVYGWFRWKNDDNSRPVLHVDLKWIPVYILATALGYAGILWITTALGATLPATDSVILIGTLLAQFLLDNKKIETWWVWAVVNIVAIYVYFTAGLALAAFQYVFFLFNTGLGWYYWKRSMQETVEVTTPANVVPQTT